MNQIFRIGMLLSLFIIASCNTGIHVSPVSKNSSAELVEKALRLKQEHPELFNKANGIVVTKVLPSGQGARAGLQPGDILLSYDGILLENRDHLTGLVSTKSYEESVVLKYLRGTIRRETIVHGGRLGMPCSSFIKTENELEEDVMLTYIHDGELEEQKKEYQKALEVFQEGLGIARAKGNKRFEAIFFCHMADVYQHIAPLQSEELDSYKQALSIIRATGDIEMEAHILISIGNIYMFQSKFSEEIKYFKQALPLQRALKNKIGEVCNLSNITIANEFLRQYPLALEYGEQGLAVSRLMKDQSWEEFNLGLIAGIYMKLSQYHKAIEYYEQALDIATGNRQGKGTLRLDTGRDARYLHDIGEAYFKLSQYPKALAYYQKALKTNKAKVEGFCLRSIADVYVKLFQYPEALDYYNQALAVNRAGGGNKHVDMQLFTDIVETHLSLYQYAKALEFCNQELTICRSVEDKIKEGFIFYYIGHIYQQSNQCTKALGYYDQALDIFYKADSKNLTIGLMFNKMGTAYDDMGQYTDAIRWLEQALAIYRANNSKEMEKEVLSDIGAAYFNLSQYAKAIESYNHALTMSRSLEDKQEEGTVLCNIAILYSRLGQYGKAKEHLNQALVISHAIDDKKMEGVVLNNIGGMYSKFCQYTNALQYLEQVLVISRTIGDKKMEGKTLNDIGSIYISLKQYVKAVEYLKQAMVIQLATGDKITAACILSNMGEVFLIAGEHADAVKHYDKALLIARAIQDKELEGLVIVNMGLTHSIMGQHSKSLKYFIEALNLSTEIRNPDFMWRAWFGISGIYAEQNQPKAAIMAGKQAVNTLQSMRQSNKILSRGLQKSFLNKKEFVYQNLANLLIDQGRIPEAEQVMTMLKEEEFFDFIRRDSTNDIRKTKASYTKAEQEWLKNYQKINQNLMTLAEELESLEKKETLDPAEQRRVAELEAELEKAEDAFIGIIDGLDDYFANSTATKAMAHGNRNLDLVAAHQDQLAQLGHGAVLIHTVTTKGKLHLLLTTPEVSLVRLSEISAPELNRLVKQFRQVLQNPKADPLPIAQKLYNILVKPIEQDLIQCKANILMWSLDGTLRYIPMAALHDGKRYLIEKYPVVLYTAAANNKLLRDNNSQWKLAGLGVSKQYGDYSPLPAVPAELNGIVRQDKSDTIGVIPGVIYLNEQFDQPHFKSVLKQGYPALHIATHFSLRPGDSRASHLLLGDGNILTLEEFRMKRAYRMNKVDLLTLSACNTAMGDKGAGGEVESFGALAQKQGAAGVLATLWPVADASTGLFMQELYRLRGAGSNMTKAEALARVQQYFIRSVLTTKDLNTRGLTSSKKAKFSDLSYHHPFYWAPFILMGNWL